MEYSLSREEYYKQTQEIFPNFLESYGPNASKSVTTVSNSAFTASIYATTASNLARSSSSPPSTIPKEPAKKRRGRPQGSTQRGRPQPIIESSQGTRKSSRFKLTIE